MLFFCGIVSKQFHSGETACPPVYCITVSAFAATITAGPLSEQETTIFTIEQKRETLRCSRCGSADVQRRGEVVRRYQHLPIGPKPVFIELAVARVACPHCGVIRQVQVPFAQPQRTDTRPSHGTCWNCAAA